MAEPNRARAAARRPSGGKRRSPRRGAGLRPHRAPVLRLSGFCRRPRPHPCRLRLRARPSPRAALRRPAPGADDRRAPRHPEDHQAEPQPGAEGAHRQGLRREPHRHRGPAPAPSFHHPGRAGIGAQARQAADPAYHAGARRRPAGRGDRGRGDPGRSAIAAMMERAKVEIADHAPHVLVVDDDRRLRQLLARFLGEHGYRVTTAASAAEARAKGEALVFDAIVLDVMMPGETGFGYARRLRTQSQIPILMLTARANSEDRVTGLEIGADDYLPKPFEPRELVLRLGNILRRSVANDAAAGAALAPEAIRFGPFSFRFDRGELRRGDETIRITEREREILSILGHRAAANVPRDELAGGGSGANERTVDVQINRLRRKIEIDPANPVYLQTVRGVGYRLLVD